MKFGLIITINKYNKTYFESKEKTWVLDNEETVYSELIKYLVLQFKDLKFDYPLDLVDFDYLWFDKQYVNCNSFSYKVFNGEKWYEPWEYQDIYSDVFDAIQDEENKTHPDFTHMYGEPDGDEYKDNPEPLDETDQYQYMESKINDIISETNDHVVECHCDKCKDEEEKRNLKNIVI